MKTREVAKALYALARLLETCPNIEMDKVVLCEPDASVKRTEMSDSELIVNLDTMVRLSSIDKQQWLDFVKLNNIAIDIRPRDASRDILGKILRFLDANPEAKYRLQNKVETISSESSQQLTTALRLLLGR